MTPLEKAARAVRGCVFESDDVAEHVHEAAARRAVRAVLMAVREPEPMKGVAAAGQWAWLKAIGFTSPTPPVQSCVDANRAATESFTAMIDAILAEEPK